MHEEYEKRLLELRKKNVPFATAIVVRREAPSSGKTGDKAVINRFGQVFGWIGGGCTKGIIIKEAGIAMAEGTPRFIRISPDPQTAPTNNMKEYRMACHSGGTVDVYIEPVLPQPHLVVMGNSAIARSLVKLGKAINYRVTAMATDARLDSFVGVDELRTQIDLSPIKFNQNTFLVVATQGEQDEIALKEALKEPRPYLAFVASLKKREAIYEYLRSEGILDETLATIKSPAGIDIHAKNPDEVAISILAEIINHYRTTQHTATTIFNTPQPLDDTETSSTPPDLYINPVCGIPVDKATAKYVLEYNQEKVYFCCDGCKIKFEEEPAKYMKTLA
jgi:xanthine dehydrogenase accessory factor